MRTYLVKQANRVQKEAGFDVETLTLAPWVRGQVKAGQMRLISRVIGTWLLGAAIVLVVIDGTRSLGSDTLVITSLGTDWRALNAQSLLGVNAFLAGRLSAPVLLPVLEWVLTLPGFVVLGLPGVAFLVAGRAKRPRRFVRQDQF